MLEKRCKGGRRRALAVEQRVQSAGMAVSVSVRFDGWVHSSFLQMDSAASLSAHECLVARASEVMSLVCGFHFLAEDRNYVLQARRG